MAGTAKLILATDTGQFDGGLRKAMTTLNNFKTACGGLGKATDEQKQKMAQFISGMGKMETTAKSAGGKLGELKKTFTELSYSYRQLSDKEKSDPIGKAMAQSLDQLKTRIQNTRKELNEINKEMGEASNGGKGGGFSLGNIDISGLTSMAGLSNPLSQLSSVLGSVGTSMEAVTGLSAGMVAGIGAVAAATYEAVDAFLEYNKQLEEQNERVSVVTGLDTGMGSKGEELRNQISAMAEAYNVDFNSAVDTANTMMNKLGLTSEETIQVMKDGLQGMTEGDAPKFLSLMNQFAPQLRDMGLTAQQTAAVIHESLGGAFGEDGMAAVNMAGKRIREMSTQAAAAIDALGLSSKQMQSDIASGNMTIVQAIQQIAGKISEVGYNSQEAGAAMSAIFGRQGANLGEAQLQAIANLNLNLDETKLRTGEIGEMNNRLQDSYNRLNQATSELFNYTEDGLGEIGSQLRNDLINALAEVLESLQSYKDEMTAIVQTGTEAWDNIKEHAMLLIGVISDMISICGDLLNTFHEVGAEAKIAFEISQIPMEAVALELKVIKEVLDWIAIGARFVREKFDEWKNSMASNWNFGWLDDLKSGLQKVVGWIGEALQKYRALKKELGGGTESHNGNGKTAGGGGSYGGGQFVDKAGHSHKTQAECDQANKAIDRRNAKENTPTHTGSTGGGSHSGGTTSHKTTTTTPKATRTSATTPKKEYYASGTSDPKELVKLEAVEFEAYNENQVESLSMLKNALSEAQKKLEHTTDPEQYKSLFGTISDLQERIKLQPKAMEMGMSTENMLSMNKATQIPMNFTQLSTAPTNKATDQQSEDDWNIYQQIQKQAAAVNPSEMMGSELTKISFGLDISDEEWEALITEINEKLESLNLPTIKLNVDKQSIEQVSNGGKNAQKSWQYATQAINSVGSALQNSNNKGVNIAGIVGQAIANVALGFAQASADAGKQNWIVWLAATAAGLATMIATVAQIKSVTSGYAEGGLIKGSTFAGDAVPIMANAGEIVLNASQQDTLANNIMRSAGDNEGGNSTISGEQIVTVINAYGRRSGRGEILK